MGTLVMIEFLTVDGVMQGLGSPQEDPEGGFPHGGWGAPYARSIHQVTASSGLERTSAYLFGRRTYEKMAAFWPHQPGDDPMAAHLNATPKYVASRTLTEAAWAGTRILASCSRRTWSTRSGCSSIRCSWERGSACSVSCRPRATSR